MTQNLLSVKPKKTLKELQLNLEQNATLVYLIYIYNTSRKLKHLVHCNTKINSLLSQGFLYLLRDGNTGGTKGLWAPQFFL